MKWSPSQGKALDAIAAWLRDPHRKQTFYLAGLAGSGKSTILKHALAEMRGKVCYAAPTGKAALVMRRKGLPTSGTIHSLIYSVTGGDPLSPETLVKMREEMKRLRAIPEPGAQQTADNLAKQLERAEQDQDRKGPSFKLNPTSALATASLGVIDECFVAGTRVDTPRGAVAIENLRAGDEILNAAGRDYVKRTVRRKADQIVQIVIAGTCLACSPDHPFFTERGLCRARELEPGDQLLSTGAAMRFLREVLQATSKGRWIGKILLSALQYELVAALPGVQGEALYRGAQPEVRRVQNAMAAFWFREGSEGTGAPSTAQTDFPTGGAREDFSGASKDRVRSENSWRQRQASSEASGAVKNGAWRCLGDGARREDGASSIPLQDRRGAAGEDDCNRDRWADTLLVKGSSCRSTEDGVSSFMRVDRVEVLEQGDSRLDRFRDADGQLYLYDLEGTFHHSFSVEGMLVHNCSMVDDRIGRDLESFGVPLLVVGDPAQLPPVYGAGYFTSRDPDAHLDEIHRQALDSPILRLADLARRGERLPIGQIGEGVDVRRYGDPSLEARAMSAGMILVGRNRTRHACNAKIRRLLGRGDEPAPVAGDRVVGLRNDHELGLVNGSTWVVDRCLPDLNKMTARLDITSTDDDKDRLETTAWLHPFMAREEELTGRHDRRSFSELTYSYALTVHKAQGSEFDDVLLFDESKSFGVDARRHLYTGLTRSSKALTVVVP